MPLALAFPDVPATDVPATAAAANRILSGISPAGSPAVEAGFGVGAAGTQQDELAACARAVAACASAACCLSRAFWMPSSVTHPPTDASPARSRKTTSAYQTAPRTATPVPIG